MYNLHLRANKTHTLKLTEINLDMKWFFKVYLDIFKTFSWSIKFENESVTYLKILLYIIICKNIKIWVKRCDIINL